MISQAATEFNRTKEKQLEMLSQKIKELEQANKVVSILILHYRHPTNCFIVFPNIFFM